MTGLELFIITNDEARAVEAHDKCGVVRALADATVKRDFVATSEMLPRLAQLEAQLWQELRCPPRPSATDRLLYGVTPLFAAIVTR